MGYIVLGSLKIKFKFDSITSHEPVFDLAGSVYTEFGLESDIQYNPAYSIPGVISPVFRLASITKYEPYVNCIVAEGNAILRLKLTSAEESNFSKVIEAGEISSLSYGLDYQIEPYGIVYDSVGNAYVLAYYAGISSKDLILKFDSTFTSILWKKEVDSGHYPGFRRIFIDSSDNIYICSTGLSTCIKVNSSNGNIIWQYDYILGDGGENNIYVLNDGSIIITFWQTLDSGQDALIIAKYTENTEVWKVVAKDTNFYDYGLTEYEGYLYIVGDIYNTNWNNYTDGICKIDKFTGAISWFKNIGAFDNVLSFPASCQIDSEGIWVHVWTDTSRIIRLGLDGSFIKTYITKESNTVVDSGDLLYKSPDGKVVIATSTNSDKILGLINLNSDGTVFRIDTIESDKSNAFYYWLFGNWTMDWNKDLKGIGEYFITSFSTDSIATFSNPESDFTFEETTEDFTGGSINVVSDVVGYIVVNITSYSFSDAPADVPASIYKIQVIRYTAIEGFAIQGTGNVKVSFVLQSLVERTGAFGPITSNLILDLSASQGDCAYDQHLLGISSYSPRLYSEPNLLLDLSLGSFVFPSNKEFVEFYESNEFINNTSLSGGVVTTNQLPDISNNVILPDFSYMSKNFPFLGYTRIRKIFAKNVCGEFARYIHIGIDYPLVALNDINLITIGTATDTYGSGKSGWTSTGLVKDNISTGWLTENTILEVEYKQYANFVIWEGQIVKLSDGFGYSVFCVVIDVTTVDTNITLVKLVSLEEIKKPLIADKTLLIGLRTAQNIDDGDFVPIWLLNIIPFNAREIENQRVRLFAQGIL